MSRFKCTAAGDAMVFRRTVDYEGFDELKDFIGKAISGI